METHATLHNNDSSTITHLHNRDSEGWWQTHAALQNKDRSTITNPQIEILKGEVDGKLK